MIMEQDLCWFGYADNLHRPLKIEVELELKRGIAPMGDAAEGLEAISKREYPLILFNNPTPVGEPALVKGINLGYWVDTDCCVIARARDIQPVTPIILTHIGFFVGYWNNFYTAIKKYKEAGVTDFIDLAKVAASRSDRSFKPFIDVLRKYL